MQTGALDANLLRQFYEDFLQMMYFVLNLKGIHAHQLFCDEVSLALSRKATRSVTDLLAWIRHTAVKSNGTIESRGRSNFGYRECQAVYCRSFGSTGVHP